MLNAKSAQPRVWVLKGYRAGENSQLLALAEGLGWPFDVKSLRYRKRGCVPNLLRHVGVAGVDLARSSPLAAPWPDLLITAGMRNEPIARWIREQSGGRTRVVHLGRTWASLDHFDLVITTPQYRLPERQNVLQNHTTLHRVTRDRLAREAEQWAPRLKHLPRPYVVVLVGGSSGPYALGRQAARRLARQACDLARVGGGSVLVTTSARTAPAAAEALESGLDMPAFVYRWEDGGACNPYFGLLGLADSLVVTGDSIAMLSEATATGKPVYIFDLAKKGHAAQGANVELGEFVGDFQLKSFIYRQMMRFGPHRLSRDVTLVHNYLVSSGCAAWVGEKLKRCLAPPDPMRNAVTRICDLLGGVPDYHPVYRALQKTWEPRAQEPRPFAGLAGSGALFTAPGDLPGQRA